MRGILLLVVLVLLVNAVEGQNKLRKQGIELPFPVCYCSDEVHSSFIAPPDEYFKKLKSASTKKAKFEVTYVDFSNEAIQAFEYAIGIWENLIYSPVPIRIKVSFQSLSKGVLGSCGPTVFYKDIVSTQRKNIYYPVALAEKILGEEINGPTQYDIIGYFNKDFSNWYYGTDGKTPAQKYDFVSTVLHEIAHGLGFSGNFTSQNGRGAYYHGSDLLPAIFDHFVTDKNGNQLVNTAVYSNPSVALHQGLTSGWLEFTTTLTDSLLPRLYAPASWDNGSSIYHLDDKTYAVGDTNSLMTPFTGSGEAIHYPGPKALAALYEMGWKSVSIRHKPLKDIEFVSAPIEFNAMIESDYDLDSTKLYLVYSSNRFAKSDSILLKAGGIPATFSAKLSNIQGSGLSYYFSASDSRKRRFVFPATSPANPLSFRIGIDKVAPMVKHDPVKFMLTSDQSVKIIAEATDNIGIKSVRIDYFINGGVIKSVAMVNDTSDVFSGTLVFPSGTIKDGDKISYRVVATDASSQSNIGRSPETGYNLFNVHGILSPVAKYVNNFESQINDFISSDFKIQTPAGFDSPALNSPHPYPSPNMDDTEFNYVAMLKYPIVLKTGGKMSYDEVVLVEPGEEGNKFGDEDFWDYVIVEGSKDKGVTWKPLIDGYDSNSQKSWLTLFNSSMSGNDSKAVPNKSHFVKREFELLANGNFKAGDTIQVRFRLFSDPYSNGWGWIIDNLSIQDIGTNANTLAVSEGELEIFPNPATDQLNIQLQAKNKVGKMVLKVFDSAGGLAYQQQYAVGSGSFGTTIDISRFRPGIYLFTVNFDERNSINRKIMIR